jgi:glycosyltransferase involved in cell wall biosynthesis
LCELAARERGQFDARQHYWLDAIRRKSAATPAPLYPAALPPDGRVRYAFLSQGAYLGGAEVHISRVLDHCDPARVRCDRIAILSSPEIATIPNLLADWEEHAPVRAGLQAIREAVRGVDVVLTWGFRSDWLEPLLPPGVSVVEIAHSSWEWPQPMHAMPRSTVVAVSAAALNSVPPGRRATARIIHNAVHPDRVRPILGRAEQRSRWGVPGGLKVAGVVSRLSSEKDPMTWIDGIAALPDGWVGVWVGTGLDDSQAKGHAERAAPGRVLFPGPTDDVGSALGAFDVFVMTSGAEGCCYALAEAWLAGVPTISKRVGLLVGNPDMARLLPMDAKGPDIAAAILADGADRPGTMTRASRAMQFARTELSMDKFGREWTGLICSLAPPPPAMGAPRIATRPVTPPVTAIAPAVRDAVLACEHRGPVLPISLQPEGCRRCGEVSECARGLGKIPGRVTLRDCLECKASELLATTPPTP